MSSSGKWVVAGRVDAVLPGSGYESDIEAGGEGISLFNVDGHYFALGACPHESAPLGQGRLVDGTVVCPWHSAEFEVASGQCRHGPSACRAGGNVAVGAPATATHLPDARRFDVRVDGDHLLVWIED
jgi:nitrite reductase/ring-hydroxylating ferredoxin subunit